MNFVSFTGGWVLMQLLSWQSTCNYFGVIKEACAKGIEMDVGSDGVVCPTIELDTNNNGTANPIAIKDTIALRKMMRSASETGNHGKIIEILNQLISLEPENERNFFHRHKSFLHNMR